MIVYGVGQKGKDVHVADDFSIHVPYGWCYIIDEYAQSGEATFTLFLPETKVKNYRDGSFSISEENNNCEVIIAFKHSGTVKVQEDATEIDIDFNNILKKSSEGSKNVTLSSILSGEDDDPDNFRRMYKVVKDDPFLKVGYFTAGSLGKTLYHIVLFTSHSYYLASSVRFSTDNYRKNENVLDDILSTLVSLNIKNDQEQEEQAEFAQPTYRKKNRVSVGAFSIILPDDYVYVTENHIPENDDHAREALDDYILVAAPNDCKGGLRQFRDASLGINISKPELSGFGDNEWASISSGKTNVNLKIAGSKPKFVKNGEQFLVGYGKGNECETGDEPYWIIYYVVILCGSLMYVSNLYFNSKKTRTSEYTKAVERFCSKIEIHADEVKEEGNNQLKDKLGNMLAKNGRLVGIIAAQLYSNDIVFNNDDEVIYDGKHTSITGFQLNAAVIDEYPMIVNNSKTVVRELKKVISFVEQNEKLMIPKTQFHSEILKATRGNPITGATIFELCAWHMLMIAEMEKDKYTVVIDRNLVNGIPNAFSFFGEFIRTLREYNEINDTFEVTFLSAINADGPCGNISVPVKGAADSSKNVIVVKGGNKT